MRDALLRIRRRTFLAGVALAAMNGPFPRLPLAAAAPAFSPTRFSVRVQGQGPDVILIPGLTASRDIWKDIVAALPGYRYHLVQVAGFAGEPARGNAKGRIVAPTAEEIGRYIAARGLNSPALVGHSMGGTMAMMVAARHPDQVGRVMVVDMLPQPSGLLGSSPDRARSLADSLRGITATAGGRALVSALIGMFGDPSGASLRSDPDVVARATDELARIDLTPELPRVRAPLTVVYAVPDAATRQAMDSSFREAYRAKRGVRLVRVDNSGHLVMADQPARFRAILSAFLAR